VNTQNKKKIINIIIQLDFVAFKEINSTWHSSRVGKWAAGIYFRCCPRLNNNALKKKQHAKFEMIPISSTSTFNEKSNARATRRPYKAAAAHLWPSVTRSRPQGLIFRHCCVGAPPFGLICILGPGGSHFRLNCRFERGKF